MGKNNLFKDLILYFSVILSYFLIYIIVKLSIEFDNAYYKMVTNIGFIFLAVLTLFIIYNKKYRKVFIILTFGVATILIGHLVYYEKFSCKIEPLLYLHNKYGLAFSDMDIVKSTTYYTSLDDGGMPRSATIKYKKKKIYVYFSQEYHRWIDNY